MSKENITKAYREVLRREPDDSGMINYISKNYSYSKLVEIFKKSPEYKSLILKDEDKKNLNSQETSRKPLAYQQMIADFKSSLGPSFLVFSGCQGKMISEIIETLTLGSSQSFFMSPQKVNEFCNGAWVDYKNQLDNVDYIYTQKKEIADYLLKIDKYAHKVKYFPVILCGFLHPDITYMTYSGSRIVGPMGDYHSIIATAAYFSGASKKQAINLFSPITYIKLNFTKKREDELKRFTKQFSLNEIDVSDFLRKQAMENPWMRTINHPTKKTLYNIVKLVLERDDINTYPSSERFVDGINDYLANVAEWPIYPGVINPKENDCKEIENKKIIFRSPYKLNEKSVLLSLEDIVDYTFKSLSGLNEKNIKMAQADFKETINIITNQLTKS